MSRLMAVSLTEAAVRDRTKTVTRRLGWLFAKPGDRITLCRKVMGRRAGDPLVRIAEVEIVDVRREPLYAVTDDEVRAEGFPLWTASQFVSWYAAKMGISPLDLVTRIEWRYVS